MSGSAAPRQSVVVGLGGASGVMALGTIVSRVTGVLRDTALGAALGTVVLADTFAVANTIPNAIYALLAGGAITAVFVPQLVRHITEDDDGGTVYTQRLLTLTTLLLLAVSVLTVVAAPAIVRAYATSSWTDRDLEVAVAFARYCLPEILFYGLFTMFQQVLNARGHFAAPMFAPIVNNVVVIVTCGLFVATTTGTLTTDTIGDGQVALLGLGTLAGIAAQALVLVPVMRRTGFRWRPRFDFRNAGLGKVGVLASWTFVYVATNQVVFVVIARLATAANADPAGDPDGADVGFASYLRAYLIFVLPHSVLTLSVVTALMPRMSGHAIASRLRSVAADVTGGLRLALVGVVPAAAALLVLAPDVAVVLFRYGSTDAADARAIGEITQLFVLGLVPFTVFFVLVRGFYALEDTRTPALVNFLLNGLNVVFAVSFFVLAPDDYRVHALAAAYLPAYGITAVVMWVTLRRRLGTLPAHLTVRTGVRLLVAAVPAGLLMLGLSWAATALLGEGRVGSLAAVVLALPPGGVVFWLVARRLRVAEIREASALVRARLAR